ncbi:MULTISPECIES: hypothetical protein [unclassified Bradyrhizobium]|uniref:hypothetical protein n=1 Tax=unclassified Bradyrhizobium TaxID=2631580 RepID=UPI0024B1F1D2|nr:hypothetical protein [Bradyrhizobium sp. CB2312]WFU70861.1 hypothetical protein QA642_37225 [Bradyrhizobium sp. CB2312]
MKILKLVLGLVCLAILVSNVSTMSHWTEARGVYDDICYLRQAHLFQLHGIGGFDTDLARDEDRFLARKLIEIGFPEGRLAPCHPPAKSGKYVLQYPPGTGFLLSLFQEGHQVVPLYVAAGLIVCGFALLGIFMARSPSEVLGAGVFGALAIYMMINPTKASYSLAPTMAICAASGYLTALWLTRDKHEILLVALVGLLLGLSVNFRLPNLFLVAGYVLYLGFTFLRLRTGPTFLRGVAFSAAYVVGLTPTLIANAINAGSPFTTTYGSDDALAPEFNLEIMSQYLHDLQFGLILLGVGSTAWLLRVGEAGARHVALLVVGNLLINLAFFLSHPIFTPYYVVPVTLLSMWSVCFAGLMQSPKHAGQGRLVPATGA